MKRQQAPQRLHSLTISRHPRKPLAAVIYDQRTAELSLISFPYVVSCAAVKLAAREALLEGTQFYITVTNSHSSLSCPVRSPPDNFQIGAAAL